MVFDPHWLKAGGSIQSLIGGTLAAPFNLVLLPAGHRPGLYLAGTFSLIRTAASAGAVSRVFSCNGPGGVSGSSITSSSAALTSTGWVAAPGSNWFPACCIASDGTAPIIAAFTPVGITGSPVVDFYGIAELIGTF